MEISDEAPELHSETADEDMCVHGVGQGEAQPERAKEQTKQVRSPPAPSLLTNAPPQWDCFIFKAVSQPPSV